MEMTPDAIVEKMLADSSARIAAAERDERASSVAWASGLIAMESLWIKRGQESQARVEDEYDELFGDSDPSGGGSGEDGGSTSGADDAQDGGGDSLPSAEEEP